MACTAGRGGRTAGASAWSAFVLLAYDGQVGVEASGTILSLEGPALLVRGAIAAWWRTYAVDAGASARLSFVLLAHDGQELEVSPTTLSLEKERRPPFWEAIIAA